ncbi:ferredoxin [Leptolyngbyaceae cyanobacterium UHCC 1019]
MNLPQYRVFVCTKQRSADDPEGCCCRMGGLDVYEAFQAEIQQQQLSDRVKVCKSGCLDHCEAGAVALVFQPNGNEFSWLPTKLRMKLRRLLFPNRHYYGHLTGADIPAIVDSHFIKGQPLKRCQISTPN